MVHMWQAVPEGDTNPLSASGTLLLSLKPIYFPRVWISHSLSFQRTHTSKTCPSKQNCVIFDQTVRTELLEAFSFRGWPAAWPRMKHLAPLAS